MQQGNYDAVVIGSGIGGLGAAAMLADKGYKILVVERMNRLGGRMSTDEFEGFKLPTGALAIHRGDEVDEVFKRVGINVDLMDVPPLYYRLAGKDFEMPTKGSISTMFDILGKLDVNRTKLMGGFMKAGGKEKLMGGFRKGVANPEKEAMTFKDWMLEYTDNELAHDIFDTIACSLLGCHTYEVSAASMFQWFVKMGGARDVGVAPRGNLVNMEMLADVVRRQGDVWSNCPVKKIIVSKGAAQGVVVEKDGSDIEITAKAVISNAGTPGTVELAGEDNFDDKYMRMLRLKFRPHPCIIAFVASDRALWPDDGSAAILMLTGTRRIKSLIPLSSIAPDLAPPGQHLMFGLASPVTSELDMDVDEETRQVTLDIEEQLPLYKKHGRILRIETRNRNNPLTDVKTRPGMGMPPETPIKNLYNVGDCILDSGLAGTTGAADSALKVVEMLKKRLK
ncbi:phytoene desaturase family protein [Bacteroidota bacterium]